MNITDNSNIFNSMYEFNVTDIFSQTNLGMIAFMSPCKLLLVSDAGFFAASDLCGFITFSLQVVNNIPEDILKVKQEVEAEFFGVDPSWGRAETNVSLLFGL